MDNAIYSHMKFTTWFFFFLIGYTSYSIQYSWIGNAQVCNISYRALKRSSSSKNKGDYYNRAREKKVFHQDKKEKRYFRPRKNKFSSSFIIGLMRAHFAVAE
jgi:hypothetical protein